MNIFLSLILFLENNRGCGGDEDEPPPTPVFKEDPYTSQVKARVTAKTGQLLDVPYSDLVNRFSPSPETAGLFSDVENKYKSLFDTQNYDFSPSARTESLGTGAINRYQGLFDTQDYGIGDYENIEKSYLDQILSRYGEARNKSYRPIQENLIAENLLGSGPGYGIMSEFAKETGEGVKDITTQWAQEGINRKISLMQYKDSLKRGDYSTMYNLALSETNKEFQTKQYADTLKRSDLASRYGLAESKLKRELYPQTAATETELGYLNPSLGLFGDLQQGDLGKYDAEMKAYVANLENFYKMKEANSGDMGGLGTALGVGAGVLLADPTGGMSMLAGGALGGAAGGGLGSMFKY